MSFDKTKGEGLGTEAIGDLKIMVRAMILRSSIGKKLTELSNHGSSAFRRIANYVMDQPILTTGHTIGVLAKKSQVSDATITRFSMYIGFDGFRAFRQWLVEVVESTSASSHEAHTSDSDRREITDFCVPEQQISILKHVLLCAKSYRWCHAGALIRSAHKVLIVGLGEAAFFAELLNKRSRTRGNVAVIGLGYVSVSDDILANYGHSDVLILLYEEMFAFELRELRSFAIKKGMHVIWTLRPLSPSDDERREITLFPGPLDETVLPWLGYHCAGFLSSALSA